VKSTELNENIKEKSSKARSLGHARLLQVQDDVDCGRR